MLVLGVGPGEQLQPGAARLKLLQVLSTPAKGGLHAWEDAHDSQKLLLCLEGQLDSIKGEA